MFAVDILLILLQHIARNLLLLASRYLITDGFTYRKIHSHKAMPYIRLSVLSQHPQTSFTHLINKDLRLKLTKVLKEAVKEVDTVLNIMSTTGLADRVHRKLRVANIDGPGTERRTQHGTDGATTGHVVPHDEHLERHTLALSSSF